MTKYLLTLFLLFTLVGIVRAQEPEPTVDPAVTNTIKERVQKVMETNPTVAGTTTTTSFGIIGTLEKNVGSTLQVKSYSGKNRIIELDKTAVFMQNGKPITREEVELNSPVLITGSFDENNTYIGKRLVVTDEKIFPKARVSVWMKYVSSTTKAIMGTVMGKTQGTQRTVPITSLTTYYNILDSKIKRTDLKAADDIVLILPADSAATASATRVYSLASPLNTLSTPTP